MLNSNMNVTPKVSVIIPCYKQGEYLNETLSSVYNQTFKNWECIIVNDGSPDNTEVIALTWTKKDSRFKYIYQENGGLSSARNKGLNQAKGSCIQFLDSDDLLESNKLEVQLNDLNEFDISICDYFPFKDGTQEQAEHRYLSPFLSKQEYKSEIILDWEYRKSFPPHCILFKKHLIDENHISFNEELPNHEDWEFWVKLFYNSSSIKNTKTVIALYRIRSVSMSTDYKLMRIGFLKAANSLKLYFENLNDKESLIFVKQKTKEIKIKNKVSLKTRFKSRINFLKSIYIKYARKN